MFVHTTVKEYLFDGVRFCINPQGLAKAICNQIKEGGSKTIRELKDGSLAFSFFNHVSKKTPFLEKRNKIIIFLLNSRKMVLAMMFMRSIPAKVILEGFWKYKNSMIIIIYKFGLIPVIIMAPQCVIKLMVPMPLRIHLFVRKVIQCISLVPIFVVRFSCSIKKKSLIKVYPVIVIRLVKILLMTLGPNMIMNVFVWIN